MKRKDLRYFLWLWLVVFGGCSTVELQSKLDKLETRVVELEKGQAASNGSTLGESSKEGENTLSGGIVGIPGSPSHKDIQAALKSAGFYDGDVDGKIGMKTRGAIMEFQKSNNLMVDGMVGKNTWDILGKYYIVEPAASITKVEEKAAVSEITN